MPEYIKDTECSRDTPVIWENSRIVLMAQVKE